MGDGQDRIYTVTNTDHGWRKACCNTSSAALSCNVCWPPSETLFVAERDDSLVVVFDADTRK